MTDQVIMRGMILAAGLGKRLRPLTDTIPKPMVEIGERPLLEHTLIQLAALGVTQVVINVHHLAERIMTHIGDGSTWGVGVNWSCEKILLETGGGVRNALPLLGMDPFLAVNGDVAWRMDLRPLIAGFDPDEMDGLLGLVPNSGGGNGDFVVADKSGRLRRVGQEDHGLIYSGIQVLAPTPLTAYQVAPFSLNRFYDDAMARGRLFGLALTGFWADIGTPERLAAARSAWKNQFAIEDGLV